MNPPDQTALDKIHRFLDEAGDTTFFGKGRVPMLGQDGVSLSFGLGMVKFAAPVAEMREQVVNLCRAVEADAYLNRIPSVVKRVQSGGFFFHAKDDSPEVRERLFKWIHQTDCSLEMVVARKIPALFAKKHNGNVRRTPYFRPRSAEIKMDFGGLRSLVFLFVYRILCAA